MEKQGLVSIVIPTYNQGPYIEDCLRSIANQSYRNIEIIIQDSESNDQTQEVCLRYQNQDSRFKYFREKDKGQSDAINRGLARSSGVYWTWICSDDRYHVNDAITSLVAGFSKTSFFKKTYGVFGNAYYMTEEGESMGEYPCVGRPVYKADFQENWPFSQPASLLLRERVVRVGGVVVDLHLGMDLDLFIKMLDGGGCFKYVPQGIADVRVQLNSKSVRYRQATAVNALQVVEKHFGTIGNPYGSAYAREMLESVGNNEGWKYLRESYGKHLDFKFFSLRNEMFRLIKESFPTPMVKVLRKFWQQCKFMV